MEHTLSTLLLSPPSNWTIGSFCITLASVFFAVSSKRFANSSGVANFFDLDFFLSFLAKKSSRSAMMLLFPATNCFRCCTKILIGIELNRDYELATSNTWKLNEKIAFNAPARVLRLYFSKLVLCGHVCELVACIQNNMTLGLGPNVIQILTFN